MADERDRGSMIFGAAVVVAGAAVIGATVFWTQDHKVDLHAGVQMPPASAGASVGGEGSVGRPQEAPWLTERRVAAERALEQNPKDVDALNILTQIYLPEPAAAMVYNQRALEAEPENPDARTLQAVLSSMVGMHEHALKKIDEVLEDHPEHLRALTYKGIVSIEAGLYDDAELALRNVLTLAGEDPGVRAALNEAIRRRDEGVPGEASHPPPAGAGHHGGPHAAGVGNVVVSGTIQLDPSHEKTLGAAVYVSLRDPAGGPPLAAVRLPPGPFPLQFQVTPNDVISMGGGPARPVPETFDLSIRFDQDGNAMTKVAGEPQATLPGTAKGTTGLSVTLK